MIHPRQYPERPRVIQIETTVVCNANCPFCPQKKAQRSPKNMLESLFRKIIDETRGWGALYRPFLLNEPLADPRLPELIAYIKKDPTARVDLDTNAGMLTEEMGNRLLDLGIEEIRFSIDGIMDETYRQRRGLSRERVYGNVECFLGKLRKAGSSTRTAVRMIRIPGKEEEMASYQEYWRDRVNEVVLTDEYRYPWEGQAGPVSLPCPKIQEEMFLYVNGKVPLCCWDTLGRSCVGDANTEGVLDIWQGKILGLHRRLLDAGRRDCISLCSRCDAFSGRDFAAEGYAGPATDDEIRAERECIGES